MDGFRFDLASALCRDPQGQPMAAPPLIRELAKDPVLSKVQSVLPLLFVDDQKCLPCCHLPRAWMSTVVCPRNSVLGLHVKAVAKSHCMCR